MDGLALSDAQTPALLAGVIGSSLRAKRDRAILATYLYHALRRSELAERRGVMHFAVRGKGSKTRYVPTSPTALPAIAEYLDTAGHGLLGRLAA